MIVAIASGKGGTGKTTVAAALARIWGDPVTVVDLDVEAPNLHLFLRPEIDGQETARLEVPVADPAKCTACGACADLCQFRAIVLLGDFPAVFPEMCHGCGGCLAICPTGALTPGHRDLGEVRWGHADARIPFLMGRLRIGEAMSPPLIREVRRRIAGLAQDESDDILIDAPPGTSCPAMTAVRGSDVTILVAEPTPFGLHDLRLAREAFASLGSRLGVVVNRAGSGDTGIYDYCRATGLPILAEIPFDRRVAEAYSRGEIVSDVSPRLRATFNGLKSAIVDLATSTQEALRA